LALPGGIPLKKRKFKNIKNTKFFKLNNFFQLNTAVFQSYLSFLTYWSYANLAVALLFSGLVWWFVRRTYKGPSEARRRALQRQITVNLLIQVGLDYYYFLECIQLQIC
jgi:hypothetical protein